MALSHVLARRVPLLGVLVVGAALLGAACGGNENSNAAFRPTDTPAASGTPTARAASMNGRARRLSTCPRTTRAIVSQLTPPIATSSVPIPTAARPASPIASLPACAIRRSTSASTATASSTTSSTYGSP